MHAADARRRVSLLAALPGCGTTHRPLRRARWVLVSGLLALSSLLVLPVPDAVAIDEPDRLWQVGSSAFADKLYPTARSVLEQFVSRYPDDPRTPEAWLMLGKARLTGQEPTAALEAFRRAQKATPQPGRPHEATFWEAETLLRLKRYDEARAAYETAVWADPTSPLAPDAVWGLAWIETEQKHPEPAARRLKQLRDAWPEFRAPEVTFALARALVDLKRWDEAEPLLAGFVAGYPTPEHAEDARYLLGLARLATGKAADGVRDLRAFVAASPTHELAAVARRRVTEAVLQQGDRRELGEEYRALMAMTPATADGLYDAGTIAGQLGREREQEAAWKRLQQKFPEDALAHRSALEQANAALKDEQYEKAVTLARLVSKSPDPQIRAEGSLQIGEAELKLEHHPAALAAFKAASRAEVGAELRSRALAGLARTHEARREWAEALTLLEKVAADTPDAALRQWATEHATAIRDERKLAAQRAALDRARAAFGKKKYEETVKQARAAAQSDDDTIRAEALLLTGEAALKLRRYQAALKAFEAAAEVPDIEPALQFRALAGSGVAEEARRQWSKALERYEQIAAGSPDPELKRWAQARTKAVRAYQKPPSAKPPKKSARKLALR